MPVLQARESIQRINEMIYAQGNMDKEDGRQYFSELQRVSVGKRTKHLVQPRPKSMSELQRLAGDSTQVVADPGRG
jgi:hypothetical protein